MAWAIIEIILLYDKTNSCLSSTIEKLFIRLGLAKVGLRKVIYLAKVGLRKVII